MASKTHAPKKPKIHHQPQPHRRNALSHPCRGRNCPGCVVLDVRPHGDPEPCELRTCRVNLWVMDVSHLVQMVEMRVARSEEPANNSDGQVGGMSLEKLDELIGKDIEDVLRHRFVPGQYFGRVGEFVTRLEEMREVLGRVKGVEYEEKLGLVVESLRGLGRISLGLINELTLVFIIKYIR